MLDRLSRGDQITIAGAVVLLISLFLPWYGIKTGGIDLGGLGTASAFEAMEFLDLLLFLLGAGAIALTILGARGGLKADARTLAAAAGGLAALIIVFRIIDQPGPNDLIGVKFGAFIGLIGAVVMAGSQAIAAKTR